MKDTLVAGDIEYLRFYLKDKDMITGSITYHDLSTAQKVTFRMRKYGATANAIEVTGTILDSSKGYVQFLVTVPTDTGEYQAEIEVQHASSTMTWKDIYYAVVEQLG